MNMFRELILSIENALKSKGWIKKADTFYINKENNWGLINFQKSKKSSPTKILFTINLGVSSSVIREFNNEDISQKPSIEKCHWRKRIGLILGQKQDYWWELDNNTILTDLTSEISSVINEVALPEINKHLSDNNLEDLWLNGISDGLTDLQRLICLTILLKIHDSPNLTTVINELKSYSKGKPYEFIAKSHIKQLGFSYE